MCLVNPRQIKSSLYLENGDASREDFFLLIGKQYLIHQNDGSLLSVSIVENKSFTM